MGVELSALLPYEPAYASCTVADVHRRRAAPADAFAWLHRHDEVERAVSRLAGWLAGDSHQRQPRGSVLVTGLRGVGKTSLVNLALHKAAAALYERSHAPNQTPEALVVTWVDCPRRIEAPELLRRVLRRFYLSIVDQGLGEIEPGLVQQARTAYLRTLGSLKTTVTEDWKRTIGFELDKLTSVKLSAEDEYKVSRTLELVAGQASEVECEDELTRLTAAMRHPDLGHRHSMLTRGLESLRDRVAALKEFVSGRPGIALRPVFVFDELDKFEEPREVARTLEVLKTVFTSCPAAFVFIAGARQEAEWLRAEAQPDSILTSVFSWRMYVPALLDRADLTKLVDTHWRVAAPAAQPLLLDDQLSQGLMLWSGGIPKSVVRLLRAQFRVEPTALPHQYHLASEHEYAMRHSQGALHWLSVAAEMESSSATHPYTRDAQRLIKCAQRWSGGLAVDDRSLLDSIERLEVNEDGLLVARADVGALAPPAEAEGAAEGHMPG